MRRFFLLLIILLASVWLGVKVSEDPGYALFIYRHWSVEMPLWFAVIALVLFIFVLYALLRVIDGIDFSLYRWKNWLRWRKKYKAYSKTNRGLIELIEGHWRNAEHYLLEGVPQSDSPLINYLAAAKAAQEQQAFERRDKYLQKAHDLAPQAELAIGLTQAELQFEQGQLEQSLAALGRLRSVSPKDGGVLRLLEKVYVRLADWHNLIKLLPDLRKAKLITEAQLQQFEKNTYQELFRSAENKHLTLLGIQQLWQSLPRKFHKDPDIIYYYAKLALPYREVAGDLEDIINRALKKTWHASLAELYGRLVTNDPQKQLSHAESWRKQYGDQADLLLTLGRLSMACKLWGKAKVYFEESLRLQAKPETFYEYGRLLEQLGDKAATEQYKEGLAVFLKH